MEMAFAMLSTTGNQPWETVFPMLLLTVFVSTTIETARRRCDRFEHQTRDIASARCHRFDHQFDAQPREHNPWE
jgi:hypothetical protein